jgi:hypothetical protein
MGQNNLEVSVAALKGFSVWRIKHWVDPDAYVTTARTVMFT